MNGVIALANLMLLWLFMTFRSYQGCLQPAYAPCSQVEITKSYGRAEWREDLQRFLKQAGGDGKPTVFLFSDTQIKDEAFVEDVNNILNSGEVPNMFPSDVKAQVCMRLRSRFTRLMVTCSPNHALE
jgi:hypothetical protein